MTYGLLGEVRHVVVDGGRKSTARDLGGWIADRGVERLELLVVTHVDADHIEGILEFLESNRSLEIGDIWFNGYRHLLEGLEAMGPVQGERLTALLAARRWNLASQGKAIRVDDDGAPRQMPPLAGGLQLTLLSPDRSKLARLEPVWASECRRQGLVPGVPAEPEPAPPGLQPMGASLLELSEVSTAEDTTPANGSSIALLAEYEGKRVLLGADAHSDMLCASLDHLTKGQPLAIDLLKVPHHGSQANVTNALLQRIACNRFLVSTNGARFKHPDRVAIARLVTHSAGRALLYFNYDQPGTAYWRDRGSGAGEPEFQCILPADGAGITIELIED